MNIFLCCTPLHVLIAALESQNDESSENLYIIINDAVEVDTLAKSLLASPKSKFITLQGGASLPYGESQISLRQNNFKIIRSEIAHLDPNNIFVFFDQSAEAQSLLNFKFHSSPRVIWLEDGISTYSVATPFPNPLIRLIKNKIRFDLKWRGSKWLGQHPIIQEIRCFYPQLLRTHSNRKKARPLSRMLDRRREEMFLELYGDIKYNASTGIVVIPHPESGPSPSQIDAFVRKSMELCASKGIEPVLKFHPRDNISQEKILNNFPNFHVAEQKYPLELALYFEKNVQTVIGFRTSALHVISAIHPHIKTYYFEICSDPASEKWVKFYKELSIQSLQ